MNKILCFLLAATLMLSLAACGGEKEEPSANADGSQTTATTTTDKPTVCEPQALFALLNVDDYKVEVGESITYDNGSYTVAKTYTAKTDLPYTLQHKITVDGVDIVLNKTTAQEAYDAGLNRLPLSQNVPAMQLFSWTIIGYGSICAANYDRENAKLYADCPITGVSLMSSSSASFSMPEGISNTSTFAEVITALGQPHRISVTETYEDNRYVSCSVHLVYAENDDSYFEICFDVDDNGCSFDSMRYDYSAW